MDAELVFKARDEYLAAHQELAKLIEEVGALTKLLTPPPLPVYWEVWRDGKLVKRYLDDDPENPFRQKPWLGDEWYVESVAASSPERIFKS